MRRQRNDAVSPILASVSLVAAAVALAATVFLVVRGMQDDSGHVAPIGFAQDEQEDRATVPIAQPAADWQHISLTSSITARFDLNAAATSSSRLLVPGVAVPVAASHQSVAGADYLDFCTDGPVPLPAVITLTYDDKAGTNQILRHFEFQSLDPCS